MQHVFVELLTIVMHLVVQCVFSLICTCILLCSCVYVGVLCVLPKCADEQVCFYIILWCSYMLMAGCEQFGSVYS